MILKNCYCQVISELDFHEMFSINSRINSLFLLNVHIIVYIFFLKIRFIPKVQFLFTKYYYITIENINGENLHFCLNHKCLQIKVNQII